MACKDCAAEGVTTARPTPHPGPRCVSHHRRFSRDQSNRSHARTIEKTYGITGEQYRLILAAQGGRCAICQKATGATKRLAVDHCHETGLVRAILCGRCNRLIAFLGVDALQRAIVVLRDMPAQAVLNADGVCRPE